MAVALATIKEALTFNANCSLKVYSVTGDNNYLGGYLINASSLGFSTIYAAMPADGQIKNGYMWEASFSADRSQVIIEFLEEMTGEGFLELSPGDDASGISFSIAFLGLPTGGVNSTTI